MIRPFFMLALATLAGGLVLGCGGGGNGVVADPNGGVPNPPDFGNPPPGQNDSLRVTAGVVQNDKKAPFTAALTADVQGGVPPYTINWDFDQDGVIDGFGTATTTTYASSGDFPANVIVTDSANTIARSSIEVHVLPPGPDLHITGNNQSPIVQGKAPLAVNFNTSGTLGVIVKWEWDYNGDGKIDYSSPPSNPFTGNVSHTYTTPGTYTPILRATDDQGNVEEDSILVIATY